MTYLDQIAMRNERTIARMADSYYQPPEPPEECHECGGEGIARDEAAYDDARVCYWVQVADEPEASPHPQDDPIGWDTWGVCPTCGGEGIATDEWPEDH
jgi:DnaJ-class molecular chaperone